MQSSLVQRSSQCSRMSDARLIQSARAGMEEAYSEIVQRYKERLVASIRSDVNCSESAEDIVQDAFVRAFQNLGSFRSESSFYTWLYRIALNSRRYYMRNRHRTMALDDLSEHVGQAWVGPEPTPDHVLEAREELEHVQAALARLEAHHRVILVLREFEGCDYQAISEVLNVTLGTVRSRLSRARAQLRKELAVYWNSAKVGEIPHLHNRNWSDQRLSLTA